LWRKFKGYLKLNVKGSLNCFYFCVGRPLCSPHFQNHILTKLHFFNTLWIFDWFFFYFLSELFFLFTNYTWIILFQFCGLITRPRNCFALNVGSVGSFSWFSSVGSVGSSPRNWFTLNVRSYIHLSQLWIPWRWIDLQCNRIFLWAILWHYCKLVVASIHVTSFSNLI